VISPNQGASRFIALAIAVLLVLMLPAIAAAHAELESSAPADGTTVPSPFDGPIEMGFSATLVEGSKAELYSATGTLVATAVVDGPRATMTIALDAPLAPGDYVVRWVSIAEDTDLDRGTISFTVETPAPTVNPTDEPSTSPTTVAAASAPTTLAPSAAPSVSPADGSATSTTGDVILPIVVLLIVVGVGAVYLVRRRTPPTMPR